MAKENEKLKKVHALESTADAVEQYSRRNNLRITGIPKSLGEDTDTHVLELTRAIDEGITLSDIDCSHRVGKQSINKPWEMIYISKEASIRNL